MNSYRSEQRHVGFDILKCLCAFLIVCIHRPFPGVAGQYFTALTRIAVPIFFMITGYFYTDTVKRHREGRQLKKIFILVVEANLLFLLWKCFYTMFSGKSVGGYLSHIFTVKNIWKFLIFNQSPFHGHLWYLGAILYVLLIMLIINRLKLVKVVWILTPFLLAGDLILGKYSLLFLHREFPYILVRNFLFVGLPYFCIGMMLRTRSGGLKNRVLAGAAIAFSVTTLLERYILVTADLNPQRDHYISTTFLAIVVFLLFKNVFEERKPGRAGRAAAWIGENCSTWIYIIHPIFITVFSLLTHKTGIYHTYLYIAPILVFLAATIFVGAFWKMFNK